MPPVAATYVLPIRWSPDVDAEELAAYLDALSGMVEEVLVVDGSDPAHFDSHHQQWSRRVRHMAPHADLRFGNGKVDGVITGLREATFERVVVADDDVRYDQQALADVVAGLDADDAVVPQNYFAPLPWYARWDTARTLLNRVTGGDFPGTLGVRRHTILDAGGYDGDVMFENLELLRTVEAVGGSVRWLHGCYVRRLPGTAERFLSQRVRQAYDEHARPLRLALALAVVPATAAAVAARRWRALSAATAVVVAVAEAGRRRDGGRTVFPATAVLFAPLWVLERGICAWPALVLRLLGGVPYRGGRLVRAATPPRQLRERVARRRTGTMPDDDHGPAERSRSRAAAS